MHENILPYHLVDNQVSTREKILLTNIKQLSCLCYCDLSLDHLATACGIRKQSILYYFKTKQIITVESLALVQAHHSACVEKILREHAVSPDQLMVEFIKLVNGFFFETSCGPFMCRLAHSHTQNNQLILAAIKPLVAFWETAFARVLDLLGIESADAVATSLLMQLHSAVLLGQLYDTERYAQQFIDQISQHAMLENVV